MTSKKNAKSASGNVEAKHETPVVDTSSATQTIESAPGQHTPPLPKKAGHPEGVQALKEYFEEILRLVHKRVASNHNQIDLLLTALITQKHADLVGESGLGKTYSIEQLLKVVNVKEHYQTLTGDPELMPSALYQYTSVDSDKISSVPVFLKKAAIFFLDEYNRIPPKSLNVLLDPMNSKTLKMKDGSCAYLGFNIEQGDLRLDLDEPRYFCMLFASNPQSRGGNFPPPDAILDRVGLQIHFPPLLPEDRRKIEQLTKRTKINTIEKEHPGYDFFATLCHVNELLESDPSLAGLGQNLSVRVQKFLDYLIPIRDLIYEYLLSLNLNPIKSDRYRREESALLWSRDLETLVADHDLLSIIDPEGKLDIYDLPLNSRKMLTAKIQGIINGYDLGSKIAKEFGVEPGNGWNSLYGNLARLIVERFPYIRSIEVGVSGRMAKDITQLVKALAFVQSVQSSSSTTLLPEWTDAGYKAVFRDLSYAACAHRIRFLQGTPESEKLELFRKALDYAFDCQGIREELDMHLVFVPAIAGIRRSSQGKPGNEKGSTQDLTVIANGFHLAATPVTQAQYKIVTAQNPSYFRNQHDSDLRPVENVTWYDAIEFCNKLSDREGRLPAYKITRRFPQIGYPITSAKVVWNKTANGYRLPTEAEWVCAARGGADGAKDGYSYAGSNNPDEVAWHNGNSGDATHPVARKAPNQLGLYDMSGNVAEWSWDSPGFKFLMKNSDNKVQIFSRLRAMNGGSFSWTKEDINLTNPQSYHSGNRFSNVGFRVALPAELVPGLAYPATVPGAAKRTRRLILWGLLSLAVLIPALVFAIKTIDFTGPLKMSFVEIAGGTFKMGDSENGPVHNVTLSAYRIGTTEVTKAQYAEAMGLDSEPGNIGLEARNLPVDSVTWYDAVEFCNKLSAKEGRTPAYTLAKRLPEAGYPITSAEVVWNKDANGYRLPTEAEWEYAASGGAEGISDGYIYSGSNNPDEVAWYKENSNDENHMVALKSPNQLGLYDMSGNVWEWCWDWKADYSTKAQSDPAGAAKGEIRINRGGSRHSEKPIIKLARRNWNEPAKRFTDLGFRVVLPPN